MAGQYVLNIEMRAPGGLLATYFAKNELSEPVLASRLGAAELAARPAESVFCRADAVSCDATRVAARHRRLFVCVWSGISHSIVVLPF